MTTSLVVISQLEGDDQIKHAISMLFEPSEDLLPIATGTLAGSSTYHDWCEKIREKLKQNLSQTEKGDGVAQKLLVNIISAHPRLGAKKVESSQSQTEQRQLRDEKTVIALSELNSAYEAKFGIKFVIFVNGRGRDTIVQIMRERLDTSTVHKEMASAIDAMVDIAHDRHTKLGRS